MWLFSGKCTSKARLDGKTVVITGANTGIGKVTARELALRGARVVMACRDLERARVAADDIRAELRERLEREDEPGECARVIMACRDLKKAQSAVEDIRAELGASKQPSQRVGELEVVQLNLASLKSVRQCAKELLEREPKIHILINNAGVMACPRSLTEDGLETQLGVNHMAHFLLTCLLLPRLRASAPARIVNVSSLAHTGGRINFDDLMGEKHYSPAWNYAQSKLANVLFTKELAIRLKKVGVTDVTVYALHPGVVATELSRHLSSAIIPGATFFWDRVMKVFIKSPLQGAQTTLHCVLDEEAGKETGLYYSDCRKTVPSARARDAETAARLWEESAKLTGLGDFDPFTAPDS